MHTLTDQERAIVGMVRDAQRANVELLIVPGIAAVPRRRRRLLINSFRVTRPAASQAMLACAVPLITLAA